VPAAASQPAPLQSLGTLPSPAPATPTAPPSARFVESVREPARERRGLHPAAYAFIAMAATFGGVAAFVLFSRPAPAPPEAKAVTTPTSVEATAPLPTHAPPPPPEATTTAEAPLPEVAATSTARAVAGGPAPKRGEKADPKAASTGPGVDMSGFGGPSVAGPTATGEAPGGAAGGGQLSQGEMSAVIEQNRPFMTRKCWQPALDASPKNGKKSARVTAQITIAPSGAVQSVSAGGAEGDFPGLSSCIAGRIKGWKFPASGGTTTVNVPFVFNAQ
jgi:hypothetical protein